MIVKEAKAAEKQIANERAKNILYSASQNDSTLVFDNIFKVEDADKFRFQNVTAILKLPVGQMIYLDKSVENLIYDIENITNTYDGDMIERRWIMTEAGLQCVDCDGLSEEDEMNEQREININGTGIHIHSKGSKVKVDRRGVRVNSEDANVIVDEDGIEVKTK